MVVGDEVAPGPAPLDDAVRPLPHARCSAELLPEWSAVSSTRKRGIPRYSARQGRRSLAPDPADRLRTTANTAAASPSTPTTSPAMPSQRAVESLLDAVDMALSAR